MKFFRKEYFLNKNRKIIASFFILILLLFIVSTLGIIFGSTYISLHDLFKSIGNPNDPNNIILFKIRFPRVLGAIFAGSGLALAGMILQSLMQNKLVSPNTIGISSGAGFMVVLFISLFGYIVSLLPLIAFIGAFLSTMVIYLISIKCGSTRHSIVLAGIAISSLFQSLIKLLFVFDQNLMPESNDFMVGSLSNVTINEMLPSIIIIFGASITSIFLANKLNVLALGDKMASSLGVNVKLYTFIFIILSSLLASSVIAYAGLLGFVGLIVPHITKKIIGGNHLLNLPFSCLLGAFLVVLCDLITRIVFSPYEVPCGIIISMLGVPFFIYLLFRRKNND
ncbi:MAG: FecCD family ABC transporter permease [Anaeroplasma sp.]